jgi:RNase P subunit RPR2
MFFRQNMLSVFVVFMVRLKCKKCGNVFEQNLTAGMVLGPHIGPYKRVKCPVCGQSSWFNVYSSVKDPVTWPPEEKKAEQPAQQLTEEELEKKRIEESKYEST